MSEHIGFEEALNLAAMALDKWPIPKYGASDLPTRLVRADWHWILDGRGEEIGLTQSGGKTIWKSHWMAKRIELGLEKKVEEEVMSDAAQEDTGAHYRYSHRTKVSQADADRGYVDVKLDPYRICSIYQVGGGPREHIVKKGLRGLRKGDTELGLIKQLRDALDRWEEMVKEDCQ